MAKKNRNRANERRSLACEVEEPFRLLFVALAERNRRPLSAEIRLAVEEHLRRAGIESPALLPKKRGRPPKSGWRLETTQTQEQARVNRLQAEEQALAAEGGNDDEA